MTWNTLESYKKRYQIQYFNVQVMCLGLENIFRLQRYLIKSDLLQEDCYSALQRRLEISLCRIAF